MLYLGIMSGTSLDGVDVALCDVSGRPPARRASLVAFRMTSYSRERRRRILEVTEKGTTAAVARLHAELAAWHAEAARALLEQAGVRPEDVRAVGSHGQTVWHEPARDSNLPGVTLQLGDPSVLAEHLGIPVVADFRAADVAAGGQGAPLVPWVDQALFAGEDRWRAIQNLGGMGNVTCVPSRSRPGEALLAFDTGPGVAVIDAVCEIVTEGQQTFDRDGAMARKGHVDPGWIQRNLEEDSFLRQMPPRTTGRERYGREFARRLVEQVTGRSLAGSRAAAAVCVATATAWTAATIADAYRRFVLPGRDLEACYLSGGGARNPALVGAIEKALAPLPVRSLAALGVDPDAKEALAFAMLAHAHLEGIPANVPEATGARGPRVLGSYTPAPGRLPARDRRDPQ